MTRVRHLMAALMADESGVSSVEYGLIIGAVSLLIVAGAVILGTAINDFLANLASWFTP
ncbi:MAG: Flp family type IVb pilin [Alphaproteobacteria bacterium]